jgi:hypothetical protein
MVKHQGLRSLCCHISPAYCVARSSHAPAHKSRPFRHRQCSGVQLRWCMCCAWSLQEEAETEAGEACHRGGTKALKELSFGKHGVVQDDADSPSWGGMSRDGSGFGYFSGEGSNRGVRGEGSGSAKGGHRSGDASSRGHRTTGEGSGSGRGVNYSSESSMSHTQLHSGGAMFRVTSSQNLDTDADTSHLFSVSLLKVPLPLCPSSAWYVHLACPVKLAPCSHGDGYQVVARLQYAIELAPCQWTKGPHR